MRVGTGELLVALADNLGKERRDDELEVRFNDGVVVPGIGRWELFLHLDEAGPRP